MNFKQLEYFSAVAEAKSISMAAKKLHVAQPPVSRQISMLEDELGVCLFLRNNKGIELTEAGRSLYEQSQQMFQNLRRMTDSVRDIDAGVRGLLKLGVIYSDLPVVMEHLKEYHACYPQVELYIRLGSPNDLLEDLNRGELHLLFLRSQSKVVSGLREKVLRDLAYRGVTADPKDNDCRGEEVRISGADSKVEVWVVPTNEEIMIARDTAELIK